MKSYLSSCRSRETQAWMFEYLSIFGEISRPSSGARLRDHEGQVWIKICFNYISPEFEGLLLQHTHVIRGELVTVTDSSERRVVPKKVYLRYLHPKTSEYDICTVLSAFGTLVDLEVHTKFNGKGNKGTAIATFTLKSSVDALVGLETLRIGKKMVKFDRFWHPLTPEVDLDQEQVERTNGMYLGGSDFLCPLWGTKGSLPGPGVGGTSRILHRPTKIKTEISLGASKAKQSRRSSRTAFEDRSHFQIFNYERSAFSSEIGVQDLHCRGTLFGPSCGGIMGSGLSQDSDNFRWNIAPPRPIKAGKITIL